MWFNNYCAIYLIYHYVSLHLVNNNYVYLFNTMIMRFFLQKDNTSKIMYYMVAQ